MKEANPHLAARRAEKAALLPRAADLAGEGRSYQEIAKALGIAKSTVCQWLRGQPLGRTSAKALGTPRMTARLAARYESLYHRALREWNRSKADRRTQTVVTSEPAEGRPTTTTTLRTEPRTGNAACLGKALAAMKALEGLHCRERSRREWLENLTRDAAESEDGLTRTVKTSMTRSGRKVRTVVTTRSDAADLAAQRDALKTLDEKRRALETLLGAEERAADDETCAAMRAEADAAEEEIQAIEARIDVAEEAADKVAWAALKAQAAEAEEKLCMAESRLEAAEHVAAACPSAVAPDKKSAEAAGGAQPLSGRDSGVAAAGSTRSVNGGAAGTPSDRRKSFLPNDLPLPGCDFASVRRSATLPNEVFQKGGAGKGRKKAKGGRRKPVSPPVQEFSPRRGSVATLRQELDRVFDGQGPSQPFPGLGGYTLGGVK